VRRGKGQGEAAALVDFEANNRGSKQSRVGARAGGPTVGIRPLQGKGTSMDGDVSTSLCWKESFYKDGQALFREGRNEFTAALKGGGLTFLPAALSGEKEQEDQSQLHGTRGKCKRHAPTGQLSTQRVPWKALFERDKQPAGLSHFPPHKKGGEGKFPHPYRRRSMFEFFKRGGVPRARVP